MWYHCADCGHVFEDGEQRVIRNILDYIDGKPLTELYYVCPECGRQYETAGTCRKCGGAFAENALVAGIYCEECLEQLMTEENIKLYIQEDLEAFAEWLIEQEGQ